MKEWTEPEREVVEEAWSVDQAWIEFKELFGMTRSFDAVKRHWYRVHYRNGGIK